MKDLSVGGDISSTAVKDLHHETLLLFLFFDDVAFPKLSY